MTDEELKEIREQCRDATVGIQYGNAYFANCARQAIPKMLDEIEQLKVENRRLKHNLENSKKASDEFEKNSEAAVELFEENLCLKAANKKASEEVDRLTSVETRHLEALSGARALLDENKRLVKELNQVKVEVPFRAENERLKRELKLARIDLTKQLEEQDNEIAKIKEQLDDQMERKY